MKIKYNAPTTLTYAFFCTLVVALDQSVIHGITRAFFTVPNALAFDLFKPVNYLRLFTHIAGHADWNHLASNLAYILLLGPMLEETYGSLTMALMIIVTGFVTGVLNACFFPHPLLGASGVVFMMILLASFTNHGKDDVPLTFILIVILYLGREILNAFKGDDISQFAHLAGGLCGSLFGFFKPGKSGTRRSGSSAKIAIQATASKTPSRTPSRAPVKPAGMKEQPRSKVTLKKPPEREAGSNDTRPKAAQRVRTPVR
jgi:membrane associated rhomboid family serine protease